MNEKSKKESEVRNSMNLKENETIVQTAKKMQPSESAQTLNATAISNLTNPSVIGSAATTPTRRGPNNTQGNQIHQSGEENNKILEEMNSVKIYNPMSFINNFGSTNQNKIANQQGIY